MRELFKEKKQVLFIKMESQKIEDIVLGFQTGAGKRTIFKNGSVDYCFENLKEKLVKENFENQIEKLVSLLRNIDFSARSYHRDVKQVKIICQLDSVGKQIKNELNSARWFNKRYYLAIEVVAQKGEKIQKAREVIAGQGELNLKDPAEFGKIPAERACLMLSAKPAPVGSWPVVLSGKAGGTMIHEACGHGLEADFVARKISRYTGFLGKQVASPKITVFDDPTIPGLYGSYEYDDEGVPSQKVVLIEKGVLKNFLTDIYYSKLLKLKPNGHGRRQSFKSQPIPRMANTFVAPGKDDPKEILKSLKKGIYVKKLGGGEVDVISGDFVFEIEEGYFVLNGKIIYPVRQATLMGNGFEVLKKCEAVGNDLEFLPGICGKDDQVPVTSGQPTLKIAEILVGGLSLN